MDSPALVSTMRGVDRRKSLATEVAVVMGVLWLPSAWHGLHMALLRQPPATSWQSKVSAVFSSSACIALVFLVLSIAREPIGRFGFTRITWRHLWLGAGLTVASAFIHIAVSAASWWPHPDAAWVRHGMPVHFASLTALPLILAATPVSALSQEALMRGYLITRLTDLLSRPWAAVAISTVMFSFWHAYQGPVGLISTFLAGLMYAIALLRTGSVWPAVIAHTAYNTLAFVGPISYGTAWVLRAVAGF